MPDTETDVERTARVNHELERLDHQHAKLMQLSAEAVDALPILRTVMDRRRIPRGLD